MNTVEIANAGLVLLERVQLQGKEVQAYVEVNQLLGRLANGQLTVSEPVPELLENPQPAGCPVLDFLKQPERPT